MLKRKELQKEMAARFGMWLDENLGTYDDSYTTTEVVTEAILSMGADVLRPRGEDDEPYTSFGECDTCGRMDILNAGLCESCVYSIQ